MVLQMLMVWLHHVRLLIALPGGTGCTITKWHWQRGTTGSAARYLQTCAVTGWLRFVQLVCRHVGSSFPLALQLLVHIWRAAKWINCQTIIIINCSLSPCLSTTCGSCVRVTPFCNLLPHSAAASASDRRLPCGHSSFRSVLMMALDWMKLQRCAENGLSCVRRQ
jgi:hypothetical protein